MRGSRLRRPIPAAVLPDLFREVARDLDGRRQDCHGRPDDQLARSRLGLLWNGRVIQIAIHAVWKWRRVLAARTPLLDGAFRGGADLLLLSGRPLADVLTIGRS